jgi:hypothetical protein
MSNLNPVTANFRQPYHSPQLHHYGDIKTLTQNVPGTGALDGSGMSQNEFAPNKTA